jgi:hypothetical protein
VWVIVLIVVSVLFGLLALSCILYHFCKNKHEVHQQGNFHA